jgi:hypothetical protein
MELEGVYVPTEPKVLNWNLNSLSNLSSEYMSECQIKSPDIGNITDSAVESECRLITSSS